MLAQHGENADHGDAGDRHGQSRFDKEMLPLALADGQNPREATQEDIRGHLDRRTAHGARKDRQQGDRDDTHVRVEQEGQEHAGGGGWHHIWQPGSATGQLHC